MGFDSASITVAILRPERQRIAGGYLWSRDRECKTVKLIYVYKQGLYVGSYVNTIEVYNDLFKDDKATRKSHLSKIGYFIDKKNSHRGYTFKTIGPLV